MQDQAGETPLICAARYGHTDVIKLLVRQGCGVHIKSNGCRDALSWAGAYKLQAKEQIRQLLM